MQKRFYLSDPLWAQWHTCSTEEHRTYYEGPLRGCPFHGTVMVEMARQAFVVIDGRAWRDAPQP